MKENKSFITRIYRKKSIKKMDDKINLFGVSKKFNTEYFMNFRLFTSVLLFIITFLFFNQSVMVSFIAIIASIILLQPFILRWSRNIYINMFVSYDSKAKLK